MILNAPYRCDSLQVAALMRLIAKENEVKVHSIQKIRETGSLPMAKAPLPTESVDDRTKGKLFAQEVIALMVGQSAGWKDKVHALFGMTVEARTVFIDALDKWKKAVTDGVEELHGMDEKRAKKFMNSASVRLSQMRGICKAINGGMTYETLKEAWKCPDPENLSIESVYDTAKAFNGAGAKGRTPDSMLVKLGKWIEAQKKTINDDASAEDAAVLREMVELHNRLVG